VTSGLPSHKSQTGSFSWAVLAEDGLTLQSGIADSWDDARLAMIEHLDRPSAAPTQD